MGVRGPADGSDPGPPTPTGGGAPGPELARLAAADAPADELAARLRPAGLSALDGLRVAVLTAQGAASPVDVLRALISALVDEPAVASAAAAVAAVPPAAVAASLSGAAASRSPSLSPSPPPSPSPSPSPPPSRRALPLPAAQLPAAQLPDGRAVAILADPPPRDAPAVDARLAARLTLLAPSLGVHEVAVGVSDLVTGAAALPAAVREAGHALALADARPEPLAVAGPDDLATHLALLAHVPEDLRAAYVRRLLGPLRAHDVHHHTNLEQTLDVFLQCSGSWSRSAARLRIHVNTLRYRIARIAELTGRDPTALDGQTDLLLALRAR